MKYRILSLVLALLISGCNTESEPDDNNPVFDPQAAENLEADEYGMRTYVIALLKTGPDRSHSQEAAQEIQRGHMAHINKMADEGHLILAGPFMGGGDLRGIFLFDTDSVEEAEALTAQDPAVQSGRLEMELITWYGSAALLEVPSIHRTISRHTP